MASSVASPPMTDKQLELGKLLAVGVLMAVDAKGQALVFAGRTWGDYKRAVEQGLGITDADPLSSIEHGIAQGGTGFIRRDEDEHGRGAEIREVF